MVVELEGTVELVDWWPDEIADVQQYAANPKMAERAYDPSPPRWVRTNEQLRYVAHVNMADDAAVDGVGPLLDAEAIRVTAILNAIDHQVREEHEDVRGRVLKAV